MTKVSEDEEGTRLTQTSRSRTIFSRRRAESLNAVDDPAQVEERCWRKEEVRESCVKVLHMAVLKHKTFKFFPCILVK